MCVFFCVSVSTCIPWFLFGRHRITLGVLLIFYLVWKRISVSLASVDGQLSGLCLLRILEPLSSSFPEWRWCYKCVLHLVFHGFCGSKLDSSCLCGKCFTCSAICLALFIDIIIIIIINKEISNSVSQISLVFSVLLH